MDIIMASPNLLLCHE